MVYTYYKQYGNAILFRYKDPANPTSTVNKKITNYKPSLYRKVTDESQSIDKHSIFGHGLTTIELDSIRSAKDFVKQYKNVENFTIEGNSNYANQFIIDLYDGEQPEYDSKNIAVGILDIEVYSPDEFPHPDEAKYPINAITIYHSVEDKFYTYALKHKADDVWEEKYAKKEVKDLTVDFFIFENEEDLLRTFAHHMLDKQYDVTSGWNSESFDMPYIVNRCYKVLSEAFTKKALSPFGIINHRESFDKFGNDKETKVEIVGLPHLDYMLVYKKHIQDPRESYKLDFIAHVELGENKIDYEQSLGLHGLYETDFQSFIDYNIHDVNLIKRLDKKLGLFDLTFTMAYYTLSNYEDTMGTVKIWEQYIAKLLFNENKVPLFRKLPNEKRDFEGGFVKDPAIGFQDWIVTYDLASLYPSTIIQWNIGTETWVPDDELPKEALDVRKNSTFEELVDGTVNLDFLEKYGLSMTANFEFYKTDEQSVIAKAMSMLYSERKHFKKKKADAVKNDDKKNIILNDNMQQGLKIL